MSPDADGRPGLREWLRQPVYAVFSNDLMTLLAFLIIPIVALPYFFEFSPALLMLFAGLNYLIVAAFIAEYVLKLYVAESRWEYVTDAWHVLDLLIILLALAEFLPYRFAKAGRASPALRLLSLLRVTTAAGRTIKGRRPAAPEPEPEPAVSRMTARALKDGAVRGCSLGEGACALVPGERSWVDLQGAAEIDMDRISQALGVPRFALVSRIIQESFPRIDYFPGFTTIFIWDAKLALDGPGLRDLRVHRHPMLIICLQTHIVTISTEESDLFDTIVAEGIGDGLDFAARALLAIVRRKLRDGEDIVRALESRTAALEELPVGRSPASFLEDTFFLKKEVQIVQNNLWHLRQVVGRLREKPAALTGFTEEHMQQFDVLFDETDFLYDTAQNVNEGLGSLRDLHINTISYEATRAMRILAAISSLALVPTTIAGLLSMNLIDVPYPVNIGEIALVVGSIMLIELYVFWRMGWLR